MIEEKKYQPAGALYDEILKIDPKNVAAHVGLGRLFDIVGLLPQGYSVYAAILKLDTASKEQKIFARERIVRIFALAGEYENCIDSADKLLIDAPKSTSALYWHGRAANALGQYKKSIVDFEKLIAIDDVKFKAEYLGWIALNYVGDEDLAKAAEFVDQSLAGQAKPSIVALTARARLRLARGEIAGAKEDANTITKMDPKFGPGAEAAQSVLLHEILKPSDKPISK